MNTHPAESPADLMAWLQALTRPSALVELVAFAACLALAYVLVRALRGAVARPGSVWFGEGVVDGVLFPLLGLALAMVVRWGFDHYVPQVPQAVFRLVVPVLLSLALIRLTVRVLHKTYPQSAVMRTVERSVSWVAWIAVVLWLVGVLPLLMNELDGLKVQIGSTSISLRNLLEGTVTLPGLLFLERYPRDNPIKKFFTARRDRHARLQEALDAIIASDVIEASMDIGRDYIRRANEAIAFLPDSDTKQCLVELGQYVLERRS